MKPSRLKQRIRAARSSGAVLTNEPMSCDDILRAFERFDGIYKRDAVTAAMAMQEEITPHLIAVIEKVSDDPLSYVEDADFFAHRYASIILGCFRDQRAHGPIVELFGLPGDVTYKLFSDFITEDLPWVLFATCNDGGARIESLALKKDAYEYCRTSAIRALTYLVADGKRDRDEMLAFFRGLFTRHEAEPWSHFWSGVAAASCRLCPTGMMDVIEKAYEDELIEPFFIDYGSFEKALQRGEEACIEQVRHGLERQMTKDVHGHMAWWACFNRDDDYATAGTLPTARDRRAMASKRKHRRRTQKAARKRNRRRK